MSVIDLDSLVQASYELEPLPSNVTRLAALVAQENADLGPIERIVSLDPVLAGRVLRAANAATSPAPSPITTVRAAVVRLGAGTVLALALSARVARRMQRGVPEYRLAPGQLWAHSVLAALSAEALPASCRAPLPPEAATAALLHDIGKLVLCRSLTPPLVESLREAFRSGLSLRQAEVEVLGVHHGEVGGLIAQHWRLPGSIVCGITQHHAPEEDEQPIAYAVQMADVIAKALEPDAAQPDLGALGRTLRYLGLTPEGVRRCCDLVRARQGSLGAIMSL